MPGREQILDRNLLLLERHESAAVRRVAAAYRRARAEIVENLITRWTGASTLTPDDAADLLRRSSLLQQIDARLLQLEQELGFVLRDVARSSSELAIEQIQRELAGLPPSLRPDTLTMFSQIDTRMVERFVPIAIGDLRLGTRATSLTLQRELQVGLIQGESFPALVRRLMAATPTGEGAAVWRNGELSAELHVRRTVITANNGAHQEAIAETVKQVPEVKKQAFAAVGKNTTDCCLRVHGQIQPVDSPFVLIGTPRFADAMMTPSFHWNCRSGVAMYHPIFEQSLSTESLRQAARAELQSRERSGARDETRPARATNRRTGGRTTGAPSRAAPARLPRTPVSTTAPGSNRLMEEWVSGSNRRTSVVLKEAVKEEFGVRGLVMNKNGYDVAQREIAGVRPTVRSMYDRTQGELRRQGVETITLYRGVKTSIRTPGVVESWTTDLKTAKKFNGHDVMKAEIPASRIFMNSGGPGWKNGKYGEQFEYMVLGEAPK